MAKPEVTPGLFDDYSVDGDQIKKITRQSTVSAQSVQPAETATQEEPPEFEEAIEPEIFPEFHPRPYQIEAFEGVFYCWEEANSTLCVMATGLGKTAVAAMVAKKVLDSTSLDILFVAHREELIQQAVKSFRWICRDYRVGIERSDDYADTTVTPRIVVASKDTLWKDRRLKRFDRDRFGVVIWDEAHHFTPKNKTYWNIRKYFESAKQLGLSATPARADGLAMNQSFETVAYVFDIADAVEEGWQPYPHHRRVWVTGLDISRVKAGKYGELSETGLAKVMMEEKPLQEVAAAAVKYSCAVTPYGKDRPTLIFAASVDHAIALAEILNRRHAIDGTGFAAAVYSKTPGRPGLDPATRAQILERYVRGEIRYLVNMGIYTEGTDLPVTKVVVMARLTKSESLYKQMSGRGGRLDADLAKTIHTLSTSKERKAAILASSKPGYMIIDLVGVSGRHKLVTADDILGGRYLATRLQGASTTPPEITAESELEIAIEVDPDVVIARKQAALDEIEAERKRRESVIIEARFEGKAVDPFARSEVTGTREPGWDKKKKPTSRMLEIAAKTGMSQKELAKLSYADCKVLIEEMKSRRQKGLCTLAQSRIIRKLGGDPDVSFEEAKVILDRAAKNRWRSLR